MVKTAEVPMKYTCFVGFGFRFFSFLNFKSIWPGRLAGTYKVLGVFFLFSKSFKPIDRKSFAKQAFFALLFAGGEVLPSFVS